MLIVALRGGQGGILRRWILGAFWMYLGIEFWVFLVNFLGKRLEWKNNVSWVLLTPFNLAQVIFKVTVESVENWGR